MNAQQICLMCYNSYYFHLSFISRLICSKLTSCTNAERIMEKTPHQHRLLNQLIVHQVRSITDRSFPDFLSTQCFINLWLNSVEKCEDSHKHCSYWASQGECSKNGAWMLVNCKKSCNQCSKSVHIMHTYKIRTSRVVYTQHFLPEKPCRDLNDQCGVWARKGDCSKASHRDYMKSYCTKSCRSCRTGDSNLNFCCPSRNESSAYKLPNFVFL